jgi:hypothetical protein
MQGVVMERVVGEGMEVRKWTDANSGKTYVATLVEVGSGAGSSTDPPTVPPAAPQPTGKVSVPPDVRIKASNRRAKAKRGFLAGGMGEQEAQRAAEKWFLDGAVEWLQSAYGYSLGEAVLMRDELANPTMGRPKRAKGLLALPAPPQSEQPQAKAKAKGKAKGKAQAPEVDGEVDEDARAFWEEVLRDDESGDEEQTSELTPPSQDPPEPAAQDAKRRRLASVAEQSCAQVRAPPDEGPQEVLEAPGAQARQAVEFLYPEASDVEGPVSMVQAADVPVAEAPVDSPVETVVDGQASEEHVEEVERVTEVAVASVHALAAVAALAAATAAVPAVSVGTQTDLSDAEPALVQDLRRQLLEQQQEMDRMRSWCVIERAQCASALKQRKSTCGSCRFLMEKWEDHSQGWALLMAERRSWAELMQLRRTTCSGCIMHVREWAARPRATPPPTVRSSARSSGSSQAP